MLHRNISEIPPNLEGRVAIKLHMGERGNKTHVSPEDVRIVFEKLRKAGCEPFLVETTSLYPGARSTPEGYMKVARENGFGDFPVVIARDEDYVEKGGFKIARAVLDADSLLVLSHGKGHATTAYGGAIKNLGMGCMNKESKNFVHSPGIPAYDASKCVQCLACERACFCNIVTVRPEFRIDEEACCGCGMCADACKTGALRQRPGSLEKSFRLFCEGAKNVIDSFPAGRVACITVLKSITEFCDCRADAGRIVCPDIGYLSGKSALEIDLEAISLIRKKAPGSLDFRKWDVFEKEARKVFG
jgi:uncharacterized Fe-S center protein